ncbi:MAG: SH3 domain-containing protein [Proteobacteria bacterium]|nr:SH3 domain-containing protein [Pseudomonadota bacterium]
MPEIEKRIRVVVDMGNVRSEPSMGGTIIAVVKGVNRCALTERDGDWLKLRLRDGREGWIYHKWVEEVEPD